MAKNDNDIKKMIMTLMDLMTYMEDQGISPETGTGAMVLGVVMMSGDEDLAVQMIHAAASDITTILGDKWKTEMKEMIKDKGMLN